MTAVRRLRLPLAVAGVCAAAAASLAAMQSPQPSIADAARRGDVATVRTLAAQGADVNASLGDGMTGLHWAADRGDEVMVQVLLASGAAADGRTRIGDYTPLHLAARSGNGTVVAALLKAGAKADAATSTSGVQPIHLAAGSGSVSAVTALLDKGAGKFHVAGTPAVGDTFTVGSNAGAREPALQP